MQEHQQRAKQLAEFLQTRRARLTPEQVGLFSGGRRRTPGLRRVEVALLAGVSVDWYTWLEQGRKVQVSTQALDSVSRVLQLEVYERRHLFLLATGQLPSETHEPQNHVSPTLQRFLDRQEECPAFVTNARWDVVAWNNAASLVYGQYETMSSRERNTVWQLFTTDYAKQLLREDWEVNAKSRLAQFRSSYGNHVGDPWWTEMIEALHQQSEDFQQWWRLHNVLNTPEGEQLLDHPKVGLLRFEHLSFQATDVTELQITINIPIDDQTAHKMKKLLRADDVLAN
ncbi:helix-turn-helix transcriptional regulator [Paenibacillus sp. N3.4]|uniref:helix-turn-helix transcriptional regulator n=1 Tax=Paenibacillus sp. N3.4 TaxID=2603222 RepID=UPI0011C936AB|nr:helix-turn-helix transcriptional regulator [Paenibacillus sp. N3.4]TXK80365.1 helix-turn-helix domain-containing protein [Paenibacillus sp. N3.4]